MPTKEMIKSDGEAEYDAAQAEYDAEVARWEGEGGALFDDSGRTGGPVQRIYEHNGRWSMDPRMFRPRGPWAVPDAEYEWAE